MLADWHLEQREFAQAERYYQIGAQRYGFTDIWLKGLARVYLLQQRSDALAEVLAQLAASNVDNIAYRKKLAQLAIDRGDPAAAQAWAVSALHINVQEAVAHELLAQALEQQGDRDAAAAARATAEALRH